MTDLTILWLDDKREPYDYFAKIEKKKAKNKPISGAGLRNSTFYDNNIFNKYNVKFEWVKILMNFHIISKLMACLNLYLLIGI